MPGFGTAAVQGWFSPAPLPVGSAPLLPFQQLQLAVGLWDNPCPHLCSKAGMEGWRDG